jgi:hypothetical protein
MPGYRAVSLYPSLLTPYNIVTKPGILHTTPGIVQTNPGSYLTAPGCTSALRERMQFRTGTRMPSCPRQF